LGFQAAQASCDGPGSERRYDEGANQSACLTMIERWPLSEVLKRLELTCSLATQTSEYDLRIQE